MCLMFVSEGVAGSMEEAVAVAKSLQSEISQDSTYSLETPRLEQFNIYMLLASSI